MRLFISILVLASILMTLLVLFGESIDQRFEGDEAAEWLRERKSWGWLAAIGLIASDLVLPVPSTVVITALGAQYGAFLGGVIGAVGMILAGCIAYGLCRAFGQRGARFIVGKENLPGVEAWFDRWGGYAVAASRALPLLPEMIACLAGVVRMSWLRFIVALTLGSLVFGFALAALGHFASDRLWTAMVISVVVPFACWPVLRYRLKSLEAVRDVAE